MLRFAANLSMLYAELPFLDRFGRAAAAGFRRVEFLFPYETGIAAIRGRLDDLGLAIALFNLPAGDVRAGEWGTLSHPGRRDYFRASLDLALEAAAALGCPCLNAMFGQRVAGLDPAAQVAAAVDNLAWAAPRAAAAGVTLLIEALNPVDFPAYFLHSTASALAVVVAADHPAVRLQYDVYHAYLTGDDVAAEIARSFDRIGHVQVADAPGRHEPGTGEIDYAAVFSTLDRLGYDGAIGLEYRPAGDTDAGLRWLPAAARAGS